MIPPKYEVRWSAQAKELLSSIPDQRIRQKIVERAEALTFDPEKQGKPLTDDLIGCRSVRAVGQRYRIIYKVEKEKVIVIVVAVGLRKEGDRKDIYNLAKKLIRLKLI